MDNTIERNLAKYLQFGPAFKLYNEEISKTDRLSAAMGLLQVSIVANYELTDDIVEGMERHCQRGRWQDLLAT